VTLELNYKKLGVPGTFFASETFVKGAVPEQKAFRKIKLKKYFHWR
jgi:hypothetical protein